LSTLNFSTIEEEIFVGQEDSPELLDDLEFEQNEVTTIKDKDVYKQKLRRRASQYKV
jgi:ubiquitin-like domain-containing CTD phosphatase 1